MWHCDVCTKWWFNQDTYNQLCDVFCNSQCMQSILYDKSIGLMICAFITES